MPLRCHFCGRFMSLEDLYNHIQWTNYGRATDMEPPEPEVAHLKCWEALSPESQALIRDYTWRKPFIVRTQRSV